MGGCQGHTLGADVTLRLRLGRLGAEEEALMSCTLSLLCHYRDFEIILSLQEILTCAGIVIRFIFDRSKTTEFFLCARCSSEHFVCFEHLICKTMT